MCDKWWLERWLGDERREICSLNELEKFFDKCEKCLGILQILNDSRRYRFMFLVVEF